MEILIIIFGFIAGVAGGMGMGGGTLLVPLLSFLDIPQHTVQSANLLSFLPMCAAALFIHSKNKLIKKHGKGKIIIPACVGAVAGSVISVYAEENTLKVIFGVFFLILAVWQYFEALSEYRKR